MRNIIFIITACAFIICSCNFSGKLTRRYKQISVENIDSKINEYIDVSSYVLEKDKPAATPLKNLFDLSPEGQKELIRQFGLNDTTDEKMVTSLTSNLSVRPPVNIEWIDYTRFDRRIIISVKNLQHWPADRISKVVVKIKVPDSIKLVSCNRLLTEYQNIDLGKLNYSNTNAVELTGTLSTGLTAVSSNSGSTERIGTSNNNYSYTNKDENATYGSTDAGSGSNKATTNNGFSNTSTSGQGLAAKGSASRSFAEEVLLKQRIVALNVAISKNELTLHQESISGIDLTGNIIADIVFESKDDVKTVMVYTFSDLIKGDTLSNLRKVKVKQILISYYNFVHDIKAGLSFEADFRHVANNHRTITESDDIIQLKSGSHKYSDSLMLIPKSELNPKMWKLISGTNPIPVKIKGVAAPGPGDLLFYSYTDARDFLYWVKGKKNELITSGGKFGLLDSYQILKADGSVFNFKDPKEADYLENLQIAAYK